MANQEAPPNILPNYFTEITDDENSNPSDEDETEYPIERILAEFTDKHGHIWYLVKWTDCPLVQSSWECALIFKDVPEVLAEWDQEKQRQAEGKSSPIDIKAFNNAVQDVEEAQRYKRRLRDLRKQAQAILANITAN